MQNAGGILRPLLGLGSAFKPAMPFSDMVLDLNGNLIVVDTYNHVIRLVTQNGSVSTFAGTAGSSGSVDGVGTAARFTYPRGVAIDQKGILYVGDAYNNRIRSITPDRMVRTIGGDTMEGDSDGNGTEARFNHPFGVAMDSLGTLYILDQLNNTVRRGWLAGTPPVLELANAQLLNGEMHFDVAIRAARVSTMVLFTGSTPQGPWLPNPPLVGIKTNVEGFSYGVRAPVVEGRSFFQAQSF